MKNGPYKKFWTVVQNLSLTYEFVRVSSRKMIQNDLSHLLFKVALSMHLNCLRLIMIMMHLWKKFLMPWKQLNQV